MIFQDPFGSLNPRQTIRTVLDTALKVHRLGNRAERARRMRGDRDARRPAGRCARPLSARILRRPAPADRHRPRADPAAGADRLRRAGLGARRLDPGADPEPAGRSQARPRPLLSLHFPRPVGGALLRRPRAGDVSRPHRGKRLPRHLVARPAPPLHQGSVRGGALGRPDAQARRAADQGRAAPRTCRRAAVSVHAARPRPIAAGSEEPPLRLIGEGHHAACHYA